MSELQRMSDKDVARVVRIRIEETRKLLDEAMRDMSVPEPDFVAASAHLCAARDVMPYIDRNGDVL